MAQGYVRGYRPLFELRPLSCVEALALIAGPISGGTIRQPQPGEEERWRGAARNLRPFADGRQKHIPAHGGLALPSGRKELSTREHRRACVSTIPSEHSATDASH
jgi:hypothetical protein